MNWFRNPKLYADGTPGVGLLFLRLFMGYGMAMHGMGKIAHPFSWMEQGKEPSGVPAFLQALGAAGEFLGGLGLLFGALTAIAALGVMSTMFVAMLSHLSDNVSPDYFVAAPYGSPPQANLEPALVYFIFALTLLLTGPGLLSVDAFLSKYLLGPKKARVAPAATPPASVAKT